MKYSLLTVLTVGLLNLVSAQVGVNTVSPKSTLHVSEKRDNQSQVDPFVADGIIIPKLTKAELASKYPTTYTSEHEGAFVYITDATSTATGVVSEILTKGFYYLDSTGTEVKWRTFANLYNKDGELAGHRNVNLNGNKLSFSGGSTTDAFSIDGSTISVDAQNHRVGFGTTTPSSTVTINGIQNYEPQFIEFNNEIINGQVYPITPLLSNVVIIKANHPNNIKNGINPMVDIRTILPNGIEGQVLNILVDKNSEVQITVSNAIDFLITNEKYFSFIFIQGEWRPMWQ